ncbi:ComEC/Rec2 family competence protein [Actinomycetaceae bacterium TAE3-ERU4]|nr:ComEC/Rec2 family competence protein [Actinomycetaceae bacterium TAE3-ERU4]
MKFHLSPLFPWAITIAAWSTAWISQRGYSVSYSLIALASILIFVCIHNQVITLDQLDIKKERAENEVEKRREERESRRSLRRKQWMSIALILFVSLVIYCSSFWHLQRARQIVKNGKQTQEILLLSRPRQIGKTNFYGSECALLGNENRTLQTCYLKFSKEKILNLGDRVLVKGENKLNPGQGKPALQIKVKEVLQREKKFSFLSVPNLISNSFSKTLYLKNEDKIKDENQVNAIAIALTLGEQKYLSKRSKQTIAAAGISHLFAISGLHVGIVATVGSLLVGISRKGRPGGRKAAIIGGLITAIFYSLLVGVTPSLIRALIMTLCLGITALVGIKTKGENALSITVLISLFIWPYLSTSLGFGLSVISTGAICRYYSVLKEKWPKRMPLLLKESLTLSLCAQLATTPLLLSAGITPSPWGIFTNVFASLLAAPMVMLGMINALFSLFLVPPEIFLLPMRSGNWIILQACYWIHKWLRPLPPQIASLDNALFVLLSLLLVIVQKERLQRIITKIKNGLKVTFRNFSF